ncbi:MAG: polysaccharide biosynthesis C-terminal domain-containing protein [Anaerolinea sp.]|nr:polysaccharide biosynthesis C-terminal domain-containing protein [Anaerolinea sp.]MCC6975517.1 polysaccharide biosynthesis C-terminal domain-containing protein [Anaerolineae bacterium]
MRHIVQVLTFDAGSKIVSGLVSFLLIRFMADSEYAKYTFALSITAVVIGTLASSFNRIYIVGFQHLNLEKRSASFLSLQIIGVFVMTILLSPLAVDVGHEYWVILILILATLFTEYVRSIFQQEMRFLRYSLIDTARTLLFCMGLLLVILVLKLQPHAVEVILLQAGAAMVVFFTAFGKSFALKEMLQLGKALNLARSIIQGPYRHLFIYFLLLAFFSQLDVFMLKVMGTNFQLATYGSAFRYYTILIMALNSIHAVLLPVIQTATTIRDLDRIYHNNFRLLRVVVPTLFIGAWAAQWIIPWIDKGRYPEAITVFQILAASAGVSLAFSPHVNVVMRFEDFKFLVLVIALGLVLSIGLNVVLIPAFGASGTAVATLASFAFVNGMIYIRARSHRQRFKQVQQDTP